MDSIEIIIPWPDRKLSPNARGHWATKEKARQAYKSACAASVFDDYAPPKDCNIALDITFCPPDKRARDLDNCLALIKYGLDGIAQTWGINDKNFRPITIDFGQPCKHGKVIIKTAAHSHRNHQ